MKSCSVWGCTARFKPSVDLSFFRFPTKKTEQSRRQREAWIAKLGRPDTLKGKVKPGTNTDSWEPSVWSVVCGRHFISRKPNSDPTHPDYCPSLYLKPTSDQLSRKRCYRSKINGSLCKRKPSDCLEDGQTGTDHAGFDESSVSMNENYETSELETLKRKFHRLLTQFNALKIANAKEINDLSTDLHRLRHENEEMAQSLPNKFTVRALTDPRLRYYTGVETVKVFHWVVSLCCDLISTRQCLSIEDQLFLTLMKLRLGLQNTDLAYRFGISSATVSEVFNECIPVLSRRLKFLIKWPSQAILKKNLPHCFKKRFSKCKVILDFTEFFIDPPDNLKTRSQTWSHDKHQHTLKVVLGLTPYGSISFVSKVYGGRIVDKSIAAKSGIYRYLQPGDQVISEKGLAIAHEISLHGAQLVKPPVVAKRRNNLLCSNSRAKQISCVHLHVEKVIERIRKFTILKNTMSPSLIPLASPIVSVCCSLTNLKSRLVK